jgi:hypothetical protein
MIVVVKGSGRGTGSGKPLKVERRKARPFGENKFRL